MFKKGSISINNKTIRNFKKKEGFFKNKNLLNVVLSLRLTHIKKYTKKDLIKNFYLILQNSRFPNKKN